MLFNTRQGRLNFHNIMASKRESENVPTGPMCKRPKQMLAHEIHEACISGDTEKVENLLKVSHEQCMKELNRKRTLHKVSRKGYLQILKHLLKNGAKMDIKNIRGLTPILVAARKGHAEIVEELLKNGAQTCVLPDFDTPLRHAALFGSISTVKILLKYDQGKNGQWSMINQGDFTSFETPLILAIANGHLEVVEELLKNGAITNDYTINKITPLLLASGNGDDKMVKMLLEHGANPNLKVKLGDIFDKSAYRVMNEEAKKIDFREKFKHFPLHSAAKENYVKVVKQLLTYGAKTEVYDYKNETPLYMAAKNGHHEVVIELIKHGAEVNGIVNTICDLSLLNRLSKYHPISQRYFQNCQRVPLNIAVLEGHLKVVQELLQNGANISIANHNRQTALHLACEKGYFEIVEVLLNHGADINVQDFEGKTPIHSLLISECCQMKIAKILRYLIENGNNINWNITSYGKTALDISIENGFDKISRLILRQVCPEPKISHSIYPLKLFL